jgi:hypothetical protein
VWYKREQVLRNQSLTTKPQQIRRHGTWILLCFTVLDPSIPASRNMMIKFENSACGCGAKSIKRDFCCQERNCCHLVPSFVVDHSFIDPFYFLFPLGSSSLAKADPFLPPTSEATCLAWPANSTHESVEHDIARCLFVDDEIWGGIYTSVFCRSYQWAVLHSLLGAVQRYEQTKVSCN